MGTSPTLTDDLPGLYIVRRLCVCQRKKIGNEKKSDNNAWTDIYSRRPAVGISSPRNACRLSNGRPNYPSPPF